MTVVLRPTRGVLAVPLLLAVAVPAFGQGDEIPTQLWQSFQHQHKVGEKTRVFSSLGYEELMSRESFWGERNKLYIKGGASYDLSERKVRLSIRSRQTFIPW